jgi:hypothetical protein
MRVWVLFGAVHNSAGLALHESAVGVQFVNDELEGTQDLSFVLRCNIFVAGLFRMSLVCACIWGS